MMDSYGDTLLRLCTVMLKNGDTARDAVQDTFIKAYRALPRFRGDCSELTWLTAIAMNVCRDYMRRSWFRTVLYAEPPDVPTEESFSDDTVLNEVMNLPDRLKSAVLVRYYENLSLDECAKVLKISKSTVKKRLSGATKILRERLKEWYYE